MAATLVETVYIHKKKTTHHDKINTFLNSLRITESNIYFDIINIIILIIVDLFHYLRHLLVGKNIFHLKSWKLIKPKQNVKPIYNQLMVEYLLILLQHIKMNTYYGISFYTTHVVNIYIKKNRYKNKFQYKKHIIIIIQWIIVVHGVS